MSKVKQTSSQQYAYQHQEIPKSLDSEAFLPGLDKTIIILNFQALKFFCLYYNQIF